MKPLIEESHIYIACPPLYRISRKKKVRYLHAEKDLTKALIDMGIEQTILRFPDGKELGGEPLKQLTNLMIDLEDYANQISTSGISFENYIALYQEQKNKLPIYRVLLNGEEFFFYDQEEFESYVKKIESETKEFVICFDDEEIPQELTRNVMLVSQFRSSKKIEDTIKSIKELGVDPRTYTGFESGGHREIIVVNDGSSFKVTSLRGVLKTIKKIGQQGLDLQRYKGLGEMNPEQLWETTMDPQRRKMVNVTLEDAIRADKIFTILMGEEVAPRKNFIERHALEIKFLDV
jgi:DNA gyrase subunit B